MEIRNLITFVKVAELGSFTKAAKALDYSQSTISFQIKQLEDEIGDLLFERINRTVTLTERGRALLEYAREISRLTAEFGQNSDSSENPEGFIHIVVPDSICEDMINTNYVDFHNRHQRISLKFTNTDTDTMFHMLSRNEADIMVTLDSHTYRSEYIIAKEEPVKMNFVTGADSKFATDRELSIKDIADCPFILTEKVAYRRAFDDALAKQSLEILPILEIGRTDIIMNMLEAGLGISFLPEFVTRKREGAGKLMYLNVSDIKVDIWKQLIYHKNKWIGVPMKALIDYIKEMEFDR